MNITTKENHFSQIDLMIINFIYLIVLFSFFFSNSREMRNKAEKMRRDKLNSFIGELATLVPMVSRSAKRMDKTTILRLAASFLRLHQCKFTCKFN